VSFDGFWALNDLNLQLAPAEFRAVIGPNGAGTTTFLDVITGKVKPTKSYSLRPGDVHLYNEGVLHAPERVDSTRLIRIEGVDMKTVKRSAFEVV
ncbi:MAG: ATP-binding cassette domain-containing protein, partial [Burkholderiaceae bacterium]